MTATREVFSSAYSNLSLNLFENTLDDQSALVDLHWHDRLEMIHVLQGEGTITIDFQEYPVESGDVVIVSPSALHSARGRNHRQMTSQTVVFSLECFHPHCEYLPVLKKGMDGYEEIVTLMNYIFALDPNVKNHKELLLYGYITSLYGLLVHYGYEQEAGHPTQDSQTIKDVLTYIHQHHQEKISLDTLAQIAGYSRFYFSRYFAQHIGITCAQYIQNIRLESAKKLLLHTDWNIATISEHSGFEHVSYFIKLFREKEGITPLQYRLKA